MEPLSPHGSLSERYPAITSALAVLSQHRSELLDSVRPLLLAWCEGHREWIQSAWIQLGPEFMEWSVFFQFLPMDEEQYSRLEDRTSELDIQLSEALRALESPLQMHLTLMGFRAGENLNNYMKFDSATAQRVFPA